MRRRYVSRVSRAIAMVTSRRADSAFPFALPEQPFTKQAADDKERYEAEKVHYLISGVSTCSVQQR